MAKKKLKEEEIVQVDSSPKCLKAEEYWQWMTLIEKMGRRKSELNIAEHEAKILSMDIQIKTLQMQLHNKTRLEAAKKSVENADKEYRDFKSAIEIRLETSLSNKAIDDVTFEIRELP